MKSKQSGSIFKLKIPYGMGVAYAKVIDFSNLSEFDGIIVKIFDCFEDNINDVEYFNNIPYFMNPLPIHRMPTTRGKYAWKYLGNKYHESDDEIPIFKDINENGFAWRSLSRYEELDWYAYTNFKNYIGPVHYNKVRHLEELFFRSTITIEKRIAMQLLRYKGVDVKDFFQKNCPDNFWETDFYTQYNIPLYKRIPEEIRGKPLIKGYVPDEYLNFDWNSIMDYIAD